MLENNNKADPYFEREAAKYENPIPSREFILSHLEQRGTPALHHELCHELKLTTPEQKEALRRRLIAMQRDGQLVGAHKGAYGLVDKMDLVRGRVQGHKEGYGYLIPHDGNDELFLPQRQMRRLFDGDVVLVRVAGMDYQGRRQAALVEILERNTHYVVGRYFHDGALGFVIPVNRRITQDIFIPDQLLAGAEEGQFVVVEITEQPCLRGVARGKVVEILGDHMEPGMEVEVAIRSYGIPFEWPEAVQRQETQYNKGLSKRDLSGRTDLRSLAFVTIDGEDAKDFDDAVYCKRKRSGEWLLYVAIADVSHYVKPATAIDHEARVRGTSVYFPDMVVPMLPEILSNELCSLKPEVDRLALVCELTIGKRGKLLQSKFFEAVICSHARLTYTEVSLILEQPNSDRGQKLQQQYSKITPDLHELFKLYKVLHRNRRKRGAIDFETTENQVVFGVDKRVEAIIPVERNEAHKLIEECMLCANQAAARLLMFHKLPALYRVHDGPNDEKLRNLQAFLAELGIGFPKSDKPSPKDFQKVLGDIADRPDAHMIQMVMLRSMSQAIYHPENTGHFGLAFDEYVHFTSPIRRYPDLLVHRAIRYLIRSGKRSDFVRRKRDTLKANKVKDFPYDWADMPLLGDHSTTTEKRAEAASRDVMGWHKCAFIHERVGETFTGIVTGVTGFGMFVELDDIFVEGLVHVTSLQSDYFHFDPVKQRLCGERTGIIYRLGDRLKVQVVRVNLDERKVDFELMPGQQNLHPPSKNSKTKKTYRQTGAKSRRGKGKRSKMTETRSDIRMGKKTKASQQDNTKITSRTPRKRKIKTKHP